MCSLFAKIYFGLVASALFTLRLVFVGTFLLVHTGRCTVLCPRAYWSLYGTLPTCILVAVRFFALVHTGRYTVLCQRARWSLYGTLPTCTLVAIRYPTPLAPDFLYLPTFMLSISPRIYIIADTTTLSLYVAYHLGSYFYTPRYLSKPNKQNYFSQFLIFISN